MTNIYGTSVSGLKTQQMRLDAVANNLANIATTGYKSTRVDLFTLPTETFAVVRDDGSEQQVALGTGVEVAGITHSFNMGTLQMTNRPTDMAILGDDGFFQVQLADGTTAYTRDGSFAFNAEGRLVTANGDPVVPALQLPAGTTLDRVTEDGQILATLPGGTTARTVGRIELARFANPQGLQQIGGNRFVETVASGAPTTGAPGVNGMPEIAGGVLEGSNVDMVEQQTTMIEAQRAYTMNLRAIQTLDEMVGEAIRIRS